MPSEQLPDTPPTGGPDDQSPSDAAELSEFNQRLASFGLGETPDPLLTANPPLGKRRPT
jgi:hypothetical protein